MPLLSRTAAYLNRFTMAVENLGLMSSIKLFALDRLGSAPEDTAIGVKRLRRRVHFRGAKDIGVMGHFFHPGYRIRDTKEQPVRFIIDAGAHIGDETLRFRHFHPEAVIVALEPEPDNYRMLVKNTERDQSTIALPNALWSHEGRLTLHDGSGSEGSWVSEEDGGGRVVAALTVQSLMDRFGRSEVDILKLDIEGAESEIFSKNFESWINRVNALIFECPDRDQPGAAFRIFRALSGQDFNCFIQGENLVLIRADTGWSLE